MVSAPYVMDVRQSRGRRYPEQRHPYRNDYARDRDRVIHSRAFRRLEAKTQVFTTRFSDHFRNRLTHTIEVAQIARTVAGALGLNTDLAEALALVHDIGHPPFGHAGENRLNALMHEHGAYFEHNLQALHIVEQFEQRYLDFPGLNLTFEVREGIVKHSRDYDADKFPELSEYSLDLKPPVEAQLIDLVDEIAYNTADLDDGFEARLIDLDKLRAAAPLFDSAYKEVERKHASAQRKLKFNEALKRMLDRLATDLIESTRRNAGAAGVVTVEDVRHQSARLACFSAEVAQETGAVREFLHANLYSHPLIADDRDRSVASLEALFRFYMDYPERMPKQYAEAIQREPRHRVICDYIAGMTDHFLLRQAQGLLGIATAHSS